MTRNEAKSLLFYYIHGIFIDRDQAFLHGVEFVFVNFLLIFSECDLNNGVFFLKTDLTLVKLLVSDSNISVPSEVQGSVQLGSFINGHDRFSQ